MLQAILHSGMFQAAVLMAGFFATAAILLIVSDHVSIPFDFGFGDDDVRR